MRRPPVQRGQLKSSRLSGGYDFPCGNYSSAKVHRVLKNALASSTDGSFDENAVKEALPGLNVQFLDQLEGKELAELLNK